MLFLKRIGQSMALLFRVWPTFFFFSRTPLLFGLQIGDKDEQGSILSLDRKAATAQPRPSISNLVIWMQRCIAVKYQGHRV